MTLDAEYWDIKTLEISSKPYFELSALYENVVKYEEALEKLVKELADQKFDVIVGIESGGLMLGTYLAIHLRLPYVLVRKRNKLPGPVLTQPYADTNGEQSVLTLQMDSGLSAQSRVLILDDVMTADNRVLPAALQLLSQTGVTADRCTVGCILKAGDATPDMRGLTVKSVCCTH